MERDNLIRFYFNLGMRQREIIAFLFLRHNITVGERTLKRILKRLRLFRRKQFSTVEHVAQFIQTEIQKSGQLHGYRWMQLKCLQHELVVKQVTVRLLLQILDPDGVLIRKRRRLRRRRYYSKGPNYLWHIDSYDKLKPYGIAINGCIDGFSRQIIWLRAGKTSSDPRVIAGYFWKSIEAMMGTPKIVRTDMGTENRHLEQIQIFLRRRAENETLPPFLYGTSTGNQKIECWWSILRTHQAQFWMNLFKNIKDDGYFNGSLLDKSLIQFCFMRIIQEELDTVSLEWNCHSISGSKNAVNPRGKPIIMYNMPELYRTRNYSVGITNEQLEIVGEECRFQDDEPPCDEDVFELSIMLLQENNLQVPEDPYDAVNLYMQLRNEILRLL